MSNVLVIVGHPNKNSYTGAMAERYAKGMQRSGIDVELLWLSELSFDPILHKGFNEIQPLEEDLLMAQRKIEAASHIVWAYPTWWGHWPALMKGFVDRVFLPGWAFRYGDSMVPDKLLKGRSARIICTMDSPSWWYRFFYGRPGHKALKQATLQFCGIKPVLDSTFYNCHTASDEAREAWLVKLEAVAAKDAKMLRKRGVAAGQALLSAG